MLSALLLAAAVADGADAPKLPFVAKYDAAWTEAKARNVPVLIVNFDGWTEDLKQGQPTQFYEDKDFLAQADLAVVVMCSQGDHGVRKERIDGEERDVCGRFGGVTCVAHRDLMPKVFGDFGRDGLLPSPLFVIASPDRKELARLEHEHQAPELIVELKAAVKKLGPGMSRTHWLQIEQGLKRVRRAIDESDFAAATGALEPLKKIPGSFSPNSEVKAVEQSLDATGREQLVRAQVHWNNDRRLEALIAADDIKANFGKLPVAQSAAALVAEWEKNPAAKPALAELKLHRSARQLYLQAVELERLGDAKKAAQTIDKLMKQFPESRFTPKARILRDSLKLPGKG